MEASKTKPPHPLLLELEPFLPPPGLAYDLGCGAGHGAVWLAERGNDVIAIDADGEAVAYTRERMPIGNVLHAELETFELTPCELVLCFFTLFFLHPVNLLRVWQRIRTSLKPGGIFAGQLLGIEDDWVKEGYTGVGPDAIEDFLSGYEVLKCEHVVRDGKTIIDTPKHWDVYHLILRKP